MPLNMGFVHNSENFKTIAESSPRPGQQMSLLLLPMYPQQHPLAYF
jgi:hypothetical protein